MPNTEKPKLNIETVLWAVMSEKTPLGAILDRLNSKLKRDLSSSEMNDLISHIDTLHKLRLVIISYYKGGSPQLYQKVPYAAEKLAKEAKKNPELLYDPEPRRDLELPPLAESPFPENGNGRWPSGS